MDKLRINLKDKKTQYTVMGVAGALFLILIISLFSRGKSSSRASSMNMSKLDDALNEDIKFDVTVISQSSLQRLCYLRQWSKRWQGPLAITFFLYGQDKITFENFLKDEIFQTRLALIPFYADRAKPYPINKLRNIAIDSITTSHFWVADMDMWPATDLYETLVHLPRTLLADDHLAIIVPSFEFPLPKDYKCATFEECVNYISDKLPSKKADVLRCLEDGTCRRFREESKTHMYHFPGWETLDPSIPTTVHKCLHNDIQEPYMMVRKSPHLPQFDERFVDYGKNKVQWIIHLRMIGYKYHVLSQSFAIDVPHPKSKIALDWFAEGHNTNWKTKMHVLLDHFVYEVKLNTINEHVVTPLC